MKNAFFGPRGLRAGWGFAVFVLLWTAISTGVLALAQLAYRPHDGMHPVDLLVSDGLGLATTFVVLGIMAKIEGRRIGEYGLPRSPGFARRFLAGLVWGFAPVGLAMGALLAFGGVSFRGFALDGGALAASAAIWAVTMIVLGFFEETLFRGYALTTLARGMGFWPAALLLSVIFGALHFFAKPMESLLDAFSVSLIGFFLCWTIARTGDLWLAIGFHASFDFFALAVFGAPNTGNGGTALPGHLLATEFHGPAWLTGGPCGVEASVLMVVVTALMFPVFAKIHGCVGGPADRTL